jgi:hypothetical protein
VDLEAYATGSALARAGAVGGLDMTVEGRPDQAVLTCWGRDGAPDEVRALVATDLRGELTPG